MSFTHETLSHHEFIAVCDKTMNNMQVMCLGQRFR